MESTSLTKHPWLTIGWVLFAGMAVLVFFQNAQAYFLDRDILNRFEQLITRERTAFFKAFAFTGSPLVTIPTAIIIGVIFWRLKQVNIAMLILMMTITGNAAGLIMKLIIQRPRPTTMLVSESGFSFPSGHVVGSVILLFVIIKFVCPKISSVRTRFFVVTMLLLWLTLVCVSRLYLQVHYPFDVLGGMLFSTLWCVSALALFNREQANMKQRAHQNRGMNHEP